MGDIQLSFREFYLYVVIGGALLGALFGLIPLILARRRGRGRLGWYALLASTVGGAIAPLLSVIVTAIFSWLIVRGSTAADTPPATDKDSATD